MPLPLILGIGAAIAGAAGIGGGVAGAVKMKEANDTMDLAKRHHEENISYFENQNKQATADMDSLGKKELEVLNSFNEFSELFEKIHNKPNFKEYKQGNVSIPAYNPEEIKEVSVGAGVLLGGIGGAAAGTAGGFAAAGATTAAVMALGTASTGTAIASLSGVAATNATLAALGGGAIAAGGGGMALGSTILGAATLGVGLMVGGIIFGVTGNALSSKADEAYSQVQKERDEVNKICAYLVELSTAADKYEKSITKVYTIYQKQLHALSYIIETLGKTDWNTFTPEEQLLTENTSLLVGLLYNMGKVELVLKSEDSNKCNTVNTEALDKSILSAETFLVTHRYTSIVFNWEELKENLHKDSPAATYYRWIHPLDCHNFDGKTLTLKAPTSEIAAFAKTHYDSMIKKQIKNLYNIDVEIKYGFVESAVNFL